MKILLVEDNEIDAMMICRTLEKVAPDAKVVHAKDGLEGLSLLQSGVLTEQFLVLLDINMPRMNGHDFLAALRQDKIWSDNVVFVFTTSDNPKDIDKAYAQNANGYFIKPSNVSDMTQIMETFQNYWSTCEPPLTAQRLYG